MGRLQPSRGDARTASERKDARAKHAKQTINKVIPALLASDGRARKGIDGAELVAYEATPHGVRIIKCVKAGDIAPVVAVEHRDGKAKRGTKGRDLRRRDDGEDEEVGGKVQAREGKKVVASKRKTFAKHDDTGHGGKGPLKHMQDASLTIHITLTSTLSAAHTLSHASRSKSRNVAIFNMASPLRPGGGVLTGATAQEETLCLRTTLYPSLREEWYRLPELGGIWTPDVLVFRDEDGKELAKGERWYVDVVSAGMMRFPDVVEDVDGDGAWKASVGGGQEHESERGQNDGAAYSGDDSEGESGDDSGGERGGMARRRLRYASDKDRQLAIAKMTAVLEILKAKGATKVVLGAWGCGAYGNPVSEIARAWRTALYAQDGNGHTSWPNLKEVVFAIKERRMADEFAKVFEMEVEVPETMDSRSQEENPEEIKTRELRQQVQDLERQVEQTRFPELKERLQKVLADLQGQLEKG